MVLFLSESDVEDVLTMADAVDAVELGFLLQGRGKTTNPPRHRLQIDPLMMRVMSASVEGVGVGFKAYTGIGRGSRFVVMLWDDTSGALEAVIEANKLTQIRTGAATGVATKHMATAGATSVGVVGSGWQARAQLEAVCAVRPITKARVYSPTPANREAFAAEMSEKLEIPVQAVATAREAVTDAEIVVLIATSDRAQFKADWLVPNVHINAAGPHINEMDDETIGRARVVAVDDLPQAREEARDVGRAIENGFLTWGDVVELGDLVAASDGRERREGGSSIFVSLGIAIEDVVVARKIVEKAREAGIGKPFPETVLG